MAADTPEQHRPRRWTTSLAQVAGEDVIDIGHGRYAHFRRNRRFAQVQVSFTAPEGVDPNPGRELTDQFKEQGWTWEPHKPGKPWTFQLEQSSEHDPTSRGDCRDALHEQFLLIIQEYRRKHGMPPTIGWENLADINQALKADGRSSSADSLAHPPPTIGETQMPQSEKKETRAGGTAAGEALAMLNAFTAVGADRFDITFTDAAGDKVGFCGNRPLDQLRRALPAMLEEAEERRHNVIVRPRSSGPMLTQLDDLCEDAAQRLRPASFLILRTSPGNYQVWVAVTDGDTDFARRLRDSTGADLTASGATRISGSLNLKERYAPAYPRVETVHVSCGKVVTRAELEALGVVALPEKAAQAATSTPRPRPAARGWPSYQRCLDKAPPRRDGNGPDISRADFTFCLLAIDWGRSVEETAARLLQESSKAEENGETYALRTARAAASAIEQRRERQR